ncbi:hypothetical protein RR46_04194 [Papilio xuthus]|uniref:Uncharacterized protein n=1 Tax=Papilio xuthus TaxID=66420 RepID=I4DIZ8_PAPXU|nr:uncharacterized protein LOC106127041 precursor [Papilio xuthus]KPJ05078.1 hypothetical protein RR46_04194 [Papilio xuthus]BAM17888.1 unknown secreted protein [Papilio xuthus]
MLPLILASVLAIAAAAPATYDQRQDGDFNVRADVQNVVLLIAVPQKMIPSSLLDGFLKRSKQRTNEDIQERADVQIMEAFVEPNTPYQVEIGPGSDRSASGDGRAVEVVIAGRRQLEGESHERDEYKLLGATEQCGPGRERDPDTLTCRDRADADDADAVDDATESEKTPEVVSVS